MLRDGIRQGLPLALVAKAKMDRGELVDDDTMIGIVRERLSRPDAANGFVLDGFPRTVAQARALDGLMADRGSAPLLVIDIDVPEDEIVRRLAVRRICSTCGTNADPADASAACRTCGGALVHRSDDDERVVRERLRVYASQTRPLVDYYRSGPTFRTVDGAQTPGRVAEALETAIADLSRTAASASLGARG